MAASWHTMAVISCSVLFYSLQWILVGYKYCSTQKKRKRKNSDLPNHFRWKDVRWLALISSPLESTQPEFVSFSLLCSVKWCRGTMKRQRAKMFLKPQRDSAKYEMFIPIAQLNTWEEREHPNRSWKPCILPAGVSSLWKKGVFLSRVS